MNFNFGLAKLLPFRVNSLILPSGKSQDTNFYLQVLMWGFNDISHIYTDLVSFYFLTCAINEDKCRTNIYIYM